MTSAGLLGFSGFHSVVRVRLTGGLIPVFPRLLNCSKWFCLLVISTNSNVASSLSLSFLIPSPILAMDWGLGTKIFNVQYLNAPRKGHRHSTESVPAAEVRIAETSGDIWIFDGVFASRPREQATVGVFLDLGP